MEIHQGTHTQTHNEPTLLDYIYLGLFVAETAVEHGRREDPNNTF